MGVASGMKRMERGLEPEGTRGAWRLPAVGRRDRSLETRGRDSRQRYFSLVPGKARATASKSERQSQAKGPSQYKSSKSQVC